MQGSFACREVAARVGVNAIPVKREKKNTTLLGVQHAHIENYSGSILEAPFKRFFFVIV